MPATAPPNDVLLRDPTQALTRSEVAEVTHRGANALLAHPFGPERRVAVYAENGAEAVLAHVVGLRGGASVVPVNGHLAAPEAAHLLRDSATEIVFVGPEHRERGCEAAARAGVPLVVAWQTDGDAGAAGDGGPAVVGWDAWLAASSAAPPPDDVAPRPNLLYTSGTTGRPKATELPPNVFPRRARWSDFVAALGSNRFVGYGQHLVVGPLHHTGPLNAVRVLVAGVPVAILGRFDPVTTLRAIEEWRVESMTLVPTHMQRLLSLRPDDRARFDVSSVRLVFQTGSACPLWVKREMIEWWGPVFLEAYGATEVGVTCAIDSHDWLRHPGSVGRSAPPYEALVVDDDGHALAPGTEGRLYFRDATGRGIVYAGDPERTAAAHLEPGVFTLGEIGRVDADGWVYVTDRFADMVVSGGVNVYPAEAEQVLADHPAVADVAGIGIPHPDLGEQLLALVVPHDATAAPAPDELLAWCRDRLSAYKCPRAIKLVDTVDRNALGKLDKRALRALHSGG
ncbi:MAG: putative fatty-acid--CoA ligase [Acidimicrobiales bacterium]|nr:putative fatty-acid--CoA ligase [Acidimicrobiales bacterium]